MKIAFVVDDTLDKPDGVQQYVLSLGDWFRAQGHDVHYVAGSSKRGDVPNIHSLSRNINVTFNGNRLTIPLSASTKAIRGLLDREAFDVIHVQMPYSPVLAHRVIMNSGNSGNSGSGVDRPVPAVFGTFHIAPYNRTVAAGAWLLGWSLRRSLRRFSAVYAVSAAAQGFAARAFRLRDVPVLPNVVDVQKFNAAKPLRQYNDKLPTIMFLGRLVPRKGCATLLAAADELRRTYNARFRVVVCGKGPLEAELKALTQRLGLQDTVEFTGYVSERDKPRYVASADIMAFPSSGGESFGIVLIEAMAAGRPVVLAGDNEGYRSVMQPRPELLFDPKDSSGLAKKLHTYLADTAARRRILEWQRGYVQAFDVEKIGTELLAAYQNTIRHKPLPKGG